MHWLKVLDPPSPVIVNSHLPAAIRSAARRGGVAARTRPETEMRRRDRLRIIVDFMPGAYTGSGRHPNSLAAVNDYLAGGDGASKTAKAPLAAEPSAVKTSGMVLPFPDKTIAPMI